LFEIKAVELTCGGPLIRRKISQSEI